MTDYKQLARIVECQEDFYYFCRYMFLKQKGVKFSQNWHHKVICDKLMDVYNGKTKRLIINIPPRYSKTLLAVVNFIAWSLGKSPGSEFIHTSYSKTLATNNSWQARTIVESDFYQEIFSDVVLRHDSNKKDEWRTEQGGCVYAAGSEGTITGYGAGKLAEGFGGAVIIDDPHKAGEAHSPVRRKNVIDWFSHTIEHRLNKKETPIFVIMQRLHEEDLAGWLLDGGNGEVWEHLCIPVLNEKEEPLWAQKHNLEDIRRLERSSPYVFAGQYMQRPAPAGGGIFKDDWWQYYSILPKLKYAIVIADTAMKTGEQHDYSVFMCWGAGEDGNAYLIDVVRGKWEAPELETQFAAFWNKHKSQEYNLRMAYVEDKASGTGLIQKIKKVHKIPIQGIKRDTKDKVERAKGVVGYVSSGYAYLKQDAPWLSEFLAELSVFPNGKHDDQVDVVSDGLDKIYNSEKIIRARIL